MSLTYQRTINTGGVGVLSTIDCVPVITNVFNGLLVMNVTGSGGYITAYRMDTGTQVGSSVTFSGSPSKLLSSVRGDGITIMSYAVYDNGLMFTYNMSSSYFAFSSIPPMMYLKNQQSVVPSILGDTFTYSSTTAGQLVTLTVSSTVDSTPSVSLSYPDWLKDSYVSCLVPSTNGGTSLFGVVGPTNKLVFVAGLGYAEMNLPYNLTPVSMFSEGARALVACKEGVCLVIDTQAAAIGSLKVVGMFPCPSDTEDDFSSPSFGITRPIIYPSINFSYLTSGGSTSTNFKTISQI